MMPGPLIIGNTLLKLDAVDSTNTYAHTLLKKQKVAEGLIVWAVEQTHGRGQPGTNWHSAAGQSLTCSAILAPSFLAADEQFWLNKAISCGLYAYMQSRNITHAAIKWPNDLYIGDRKAGGVLIENSLAGQRLQYSIVGIGINLNQTHWEGLPLAISFHQHTGQHYRAEEEIGRLAACLDSWYLLLRQGQRQRIREAYRNCLWGRDRFITYASQDGPLRGKVNDVTDSGKLQMELESGEIREFSFREIRFNGG